MSGRLEYKENLNEISILEMLVSGNITFVVPSAKEQSLSSIIEIPDTLDKRKRYIYKKIAEYDGYKVTMEE